jgi:hypothetical protein
MPRDGTGNYTQPEPVVAPGTTIESAVYNNFTRDVAVDLNTPRPIVAGGTGATNAADARAAMGAETAMQTVTNYDSHIWQNGSFWAGNGATAAPAAGTYSGIVYIANNDPNYITVEARETTTGKLWVRQKAVTWGPWVANDGMIPLAGGVPITGPMTITNTTPSTSPDTGALTVDGGVGINGSINVGGAGYFTGDLFVGYGTAQGVIRFNNNPNNYLYWNGTGYVLNGGPLTINGGLSFTGAMTATGGSFSSNVTIGGTLGVSGATTLSSLTVNGASNHIGAATFGSITANAITSNSGSAGDINNGAGSAALEIRGAGGGAHSYLSFHRPGAYAVNFGLADDGNLWIGGWSKGAGNRSRLWTTADFNYTPQPSGNYQANLGYTPVRQGGGSFQGSNTVYIGWDGGGLRAQVDGSDQGKFLFENSPGPALSNGRTAYAGDHVFSGGPAAGWNEFSHAVISGYYGSGTDAWVGGFRFRYVQGYWSGAWRTFNHA